MITHNYQNTRKLARFKSKFQDSSIKTLFSHGILKKTNGSKENQILQLINHTFSLSFLRPEPYKTNTTAFVPITLNATPTTGQKLVHI
jgi:hypothetical protein